MVITNQKSIIEKKRIPNITLKMVIKSQEKRKRKGEKRPTRTIDKMAIGTYISIITLNVNRLNAPTKRYRVA